jgi:hypothetical protein
MVHTERHYANSEKWPDAFIPVCFESDDEPTLRTWIESEVRRTWGRYLDVRFLGFDRCEDEPPAHVRVEFLDGCVARLGGPVSLGYTDGPSRVGICRSYYDAHGAPQSLTAEGQEGVARYVVRHQFGHVLGFDEDDSAVNPLSRGSVMTRGFRVGEVESLVISGEDISGLRGIYSIKPNGSIVGTNGSCLRASEGGVETAPCARDATELFRFETGRIASREDGSCILLAGDGATRTVGLGECPSAPNAATVALRRARWSTPKHCVAPRTLPAVRGAQLVITDCAPVGDPAQTWSFDVVRAESDHAEVRIRHVASNLCVQQPIPFTTGRELPGLEPCVAGVTTVFSVWPNGDISSGGDDHDSSRCLLWGSLGSSLYYGSCNFRSWFVSGPLESSDGFALSVAPEAASSELLAVELHSDEFPASAQVFDVHF